MLFRSTGIFEDYPLGAGSDVQTVKVEIKRDSDGQYWQGGSPYWGAETPLAATLTTAATFEFYISDNLLDNFYPVTSPKEEKYYIYTKARDYANNYEDGEGVWTVLRSTFIYDVVNPLISISTPTHLAYYNQLDLIGGASSDGFSGLEIGRASCRERV